MIDELRNAARHAEDPALLVGRLLLAWIFVHEGITLASNYFGALAALAKLGVPAALATATIALQLGAGAALAIGWRTRLAALALGLFCVATALLFHRQGTNRSEALHFQKDLAIAGGLLVVWARGGGAWSLDGLLARRSLSPDAAPAPSASRSTA